MAVTSTEGGAGRAPLGSWMRDAISGSTAGMTSVLALHPLDVIKTRLQGATHTHARIPSIPIYATRTHTHHAAQLESVRHAHDATPVF